MQILSKLILSAIALAASAVWQTCTLPGPQVFKEDSKHFRIEDDIYKIYEMIRSPHISAIPGYYRISISDYKESDAVLVEKLLAADEGIKSKITLSQSFSASIDELLAHLNIEGSSIYPSLELGGFLSPEKITLIYKDEKNGIVYILLEMTEKDGQTKIKVSEIKYP